MLETMLEIITFWLQAVLGSESYLFKSYMINIEPYMSDGTNYPKMQVSCS